MNWDLAQLMKESLEANKHIFKSALRDDPEAIKNLDPDPNIGKYIRDSLHKVTGITIHDSIPRAQFDKWKNSDMGDIYYKKDGMHMLLTEKKVEDGLSKRPNIHGMTITLDGESSIMADANFYISYPVLDKSMLKTLGEVHITSPIMDHKARGMGLGTFLYMVILWTCYKRYGVKYAATHAATFTGGTSESADRVYSSLRRSGVLSPVRDPVNHNEYLTAIARDDLRSEKLSSNQYTGLTYFEDKRLSDLNDDLHSLYIEKMKMKSDLQTLEGAKKLLENPEEYEEGGRIKIKKYDDAKWVSEKIPLDKIVEVLNKTKGALDKILEDISSAEEEIAELNSKKPDLSPEEVIGSMQDLKKDYAENINNYGGESEGDGMDHYQINHNALIDYFKMFADNHPDLCDKDGNLNIKYNNAKINMV